MKRLWLRLSIAVAMIAAPLHAASACSVVPGYRTPTTMELVQQSDAIVLARVGDGTIMQIPIVDQATLTLTVETVIAGDSAPATLTMEGYLSGPDWPVTPSDPDALDDISQQEYVGGCIRMLFARGALLLLFLERSDSGAYEIISQPFARTQEDVADEHALWVRAVRYYASVAALPEQERRVALRAERERLRATGDRLDALLADDIGRQLSGGCTADHN